MARTAHAPNGAPAASARPRLLVVDDEESIRVPHARFLETCGFDVSTASSGADALALLASSKFVGMVCDVRMPGLSGVEVLPRALAIDSDLAVVMLTGVNDAPTATGALSGGATDYLMKPVQLPALRAAVERALHRRGLMIEQRRVEGLIREEVAARTQELQVRTEQLEHRTAELEREKATLRTMTVNVAETLINAMEAKDVYLRGHSQRVADLAAAMAEHLGLDPDTVEQVRLAGRLHDVGKIGIREAVLNKPGKLTPEEFGHVKDHVAIGMEILDPLRHLGVVLEYVHDHHEHWDGTGYPRGRKGTEITIGGRILTAADAFDALTSKRAYRDPMTPELVIDMLGAEEVGKLLDKRVFDALAAVVLGGNSPVLPYIDDKHV